ncbi:MAG: hypothetical protein ACP5O4_07820 [bacterium]
MNFLRNYDKVVAVYLFGSYAKGNQKPITKDVFLKLYNIFLI